MVLFRTTLVFLFFLASFLLTLISVYITENNWRSSFTKSFLYFGIFIWGLTELLSFFKTLGFAGILSGWLAYDLVLALFVVYSYRKGKVKIVPPRLFPLGWEYCALGIILCVTFFIAVAYPPNNYDSMTYHLPRIEHWLQNKSIAHYYTSINRQTLSAPFAEMFILQGRVLSGDDFLMNLVQWFSFLGSIIVVSKIAAHLGLNKKGQTAAALFFATVPMAILQASSTQTDLVESFCIVCLADRFLVWRKTGTFRQTVDFGIALGLTILAKGTAYPIAFPFVLWFALTSIWHFRKRFGGACSAALVCLVLNLPHYVRNYFYFSEPIGIHRGTTSDFSLSAFTISFLGGISSNIVIPLHSRLGLGKFLEKFWEVMDVDKNIFIRGLPEIAGVEYLFQFHEDNVRNFFHIVLIIIAFVLFFRTAKRKGYALAVIASWCMFAFFIPWQPWITRLQLPLFALSAPVFSFALEKGRFAKYRNLPLLAVACFSMMPLFLNETRPLKPLLKAVLLKKPLSREKLLFANYGKHYSDAYRKACMKIIQEKPGAVGLVIGGDSWEYPLWACLRKNISDKPPSINHVKAGSIDQNINTLFVLDKDVSPFIGERRDTPVDSGPWVLRRSAKDTSKWEVVFDPRY